MISAKIANAISLPKFVGQKIKYKFCIFDIRTIDRYEDFFAYSGI